MMGRGSPCVALLGRVDVGDVASWISAIPFERWPQQHRLEDGGPRPAMVNDLAWEGFGVATGALVAELMVRHVGPATDLLHGCLRPGPEAYNRMLSVVMPGHDIPEHRDEQLPGWLARVHVPLLTNPLAAMTVGGERHHLEVGAAYLVDTREPHAIHNGGDSPRVHLMFDVRRAGA